jgi:hypothetical protein
MANLMHFIRQYTVWLHHTLLEYGLFYIDLWSLVHFWSGLILFTALSARGWKYRWRWLAFFLFAFEVVEATIFISIMKMFMPEKLPDSFTDIFVGLAGGCLVYFLFEQQQLPVNRSKLFLYWLASCTVAFVWTGNSGYVFSNPVFNTQGINWWVFFVWMTAGVGILFFYEKLKDMNFSGLKSAAICWMVYIPVMLILINASSHWLCAGEVSNGNNGCVAKFFPTSGTKTFFYLASPLFFIGVYQLLYSLFRRYFITYGIYETSM